MMVFNSMQHGTPNKKIMLDSISVCFADSHQRASHAACAYISSIYEVGNKMNSNLTTLTYM